MTAALTLNTSIKLKGVGLNRGEKEGTEEGEDMEERVDVREGRELVVAEKVGGLRETKINPLQQNVLASDADVILTL